MEEYYFLFCLGLGWTIFAVIQDLKTTEVSNWLNFSLIGFSLSYRAFYAASSGNYSFLISGILGFAVFFILAYGLYYSRAFAGGDAKLLMGFGIILPYGNFNELSYASVILVFALFILGALYSLVYSLFIVFRQKEKFWSRFFNEFKKNRLLIIALLFLCFLLGMFSDIFSLVFLAFFAAMISVLYLYVRALDSCMIELVSAESLREGDWLVRDVGIGKKDIKRSVHGLSLPDIDLLKKFRKKVLIKRGIPFTPAFLLALLSMAPFFLVLSVSSFVFFLF